MDAQRLDLGRNRWIAAGGLAFIHVRVWRGWMAQVSVAPVRDMVVGRDTILGIPLRPATTPLIAAMILVVLLFPDVLLWLLFGNDQFGEVPTTGIVIILVALAILLGWILWRGRFGIFLSEGQFDVANRIYLNHTQAKDPEILAFCDYLTALKSEADDGKRKARTHILLFWWASIVFAIIFMLMIGFASRFGFEKIGLAYPEVYAMVAALAVAAIILVVAPERSLFFNRALRRALKCLLAGDADLAARILQSILDTHPKHVIANRLMTIARLMQCDLVLAEELVLPRNSRLTKLLTRYHGIMDYKLWESRHDDP